MSDKVSWDDLCYYGLDQRVFVFRTQSGPTDRHRQNPLRELTAPDPVIGFNWGYDGSGPAQVAQAVLADALGHPAPRALHGAFRDDFVSQFPKEWRLRQGAVLRWVRGFLCDLGGHDYPQEFPPAMLHDEKYRLRRLPSEGT